jgi:hypothetical protein
MLASFPNDTKIKISPSHLWYVSIFLLWYLNLTFAEGGQEKNMTVCASAIIPICGKCIIEGRKRRERREREKKGREKKGGTN